MRIDRVASLSRAEMVLLWRDRTALVNAVVPPLAIVGLATFGNVEGIAGLSANAFVVTGLLGFVLLGAVYYTLVSTYVARRETLVLKRLRVGELADAEILAGTASAAVVLALGQIVLFVVAGAILLGLPVPVNPLVLALGALGGAAVFVALAAASATVTRSVELAQVTTLPVVLACLLGSGMLLPLDALPQPVATAAKFLPLNPAVELMRLGWLGTTGRSAPTDFGGTFAVAAWPTAVLAAWAVLGTMVVRLWFRWEPRR